MPDNGDDAIWLECYPLDDEGDPTVNNVFLCKHNIMWTAWDNLDGKCFPNPNGAGFITYQEGHDVFCGGLLMSKTTEVTCTKPGELIVYCFECVAKGAGEFSFGIMLEEPLGCDFDTAPFAVIFRDGQPIAEINYGCVRGCGEFVRIAYGDEDFDRELWEELTGRCVICWLAGLDGYCVCDNNGNDNCDTPKGRGKHKHR